MHFDVSKESNDKLISILIDNFKQSHSLRLIYKWWFSSGTVAHICNSNPWETEAGELPWVWVWGHSGLCSFQASLHYRVRDLVSKRENNNNNNFLLLFKRYKYFMVWRKIQIYGQSSSRGRRGSEKQGEVIEKERERQQLCYNILWMKALHRNAFDWLMVATVLHFDMIIDLFIHCFHPDR